MNIDEQTKKWLRDRLLNPPKAEDLTWDIARALVVRAQREPTIVGQDKTASGNLITTVFMNGVCHAYHKGHGIDCEGDTKDCHMYETQVLNANGDALYIERYATRDAAAKHHEKIRVAIQNRTLKIGDDWDKIIRGATA